MNCPATSAALTDASETTTASPEGTAAANFPPTDLAAFLQFCAGDWLSLRSRFSLGAEASQSKATASGPISPGAEEPVVESDDNSWHASERAELSVTLLASRGNGHGGEAQGSEGFGGLAIQVKGQAGQQQAYFHADGRFGSHPDPGEGVSGTWTLWPDGSLDLVIEQGERRLRERIWFTKPNLRLRSTVEQLAGGSPGKASFSSEIRRVPRPPAPAGMPTSPAAS